VKTRILNEEVLFVEEPIVKIGAEDIARLVQTAGLNRRKRIRVCVHRDITDTLHEMIIVHTKNMYVRPHKHLNKSESFHIIEGEADIIVYDDDGRITQVVPMGPYGSERVFYYRLSDPVFHTVSIRSDHVVFHESTHGPFNPQKTVWAPWAPDETEESGVAAFMKSLDRFLNSQKPMP